MFNKINGINYKFIKGSKGGQSLVFVHGSGCNWKFLEPLAKQLKKYDCYLVDLPGHGGSDNSSCSSAEEYILALNDFVSHLENVTLIGHSLGGTVCLGVASMNNPSVKNAIILNSGAKFDKMDKNFMDKVHRGIVDKIYLLKCCGSYSKPLIYKQLLTFEKNPVILKDLLICENVNVEDRLEDISIPTLIITGGDEILTFVEYSEMLKEKITGSKLRVVPNTRHMLPIAEKELISGYIREFLSE